ncbi:MAG: indian hedgehog protein-like isoform [Paenibacillus sp.]|nr:indian hedgehog protein-like isoform [Paenibacillus sp.]
MSDALPKALGKSEGVLTQAALVNSEKVTGIPAASPGPSMPAPEPEKKVLKLKEKVPNESEKDVVGAITAKIVRGTPEFDTLVENTNEDIVFKDEEGTGADKMMSKRMDEKMNELAKLVKDEWPGKKLRVTECWDENGEHNDYSTHYEGRGADLTVSDKDGKKLGRLGQLAVDAGFDWVFYEDNVHIHVAVKRDEDE